MVSNTTTTSRCNLSFVVVPVECVERVVEQAVFVRSAVVAPTWLQVVELPVAVTFRDIWCRFVSVGPNPHISGSSASGRRRDHSRPPSGYLVVGPAGQGGTGDEPHPVAAYT